MAHAVSHVDLCSLTQKKQSKRRQATEISKVCVKTKLCAFFLKGACARGEACRYAHGEDELQAAPDLCRTKMCPTVLGGGQCMAGAACTFAHEAERLRDSYHTQTSQVEPLQDSEPGMRLHDGLSHSGPRPSQKIALPSLKSLHDVPRMMGLLSCAFGHILRELMAATCECSFVDLATFERIILGILRVSLDRDQTKATLQFLGRFFAIIDTDNDGRVDAHELACGLSFFCNGDADQKARAAFLVYGGDAGFISMDELAHYMSCIFRLTYETQPRIQERVGSLSPADLARITAEGAFANAGLSEQGLICYDELKTWFTIPCFGSAYKAQGRTMGSCMSEKAVESNSDHDFASDISTDDSTDDGEDSVFSFDVQHYSP